MSILTWLSSTYLHYLLKYNFFSFLFLLLRRAWHWANLSVLFVYFSSALVSMFAYSSFLFLPKFIFVCFNNVISFIWVILIYLHHIIILNTAEILSCWFYDFVYSSLSCNFAMNLWSELQSARSCFIGSRM